MSNDGSSLQTKLYLPKERLVIVVGNYGSGKTEVSVNLAVSLAKQGKKVRLADLDIVNPYFRSREAQHIMEAHNVEVIVPPGEQRYADLPIVLPQIKGMLESTGEDFSIFDVGGDDVGAKMLSSLYEFFGGAPYSLLQVINSKRPFTDSVAGCLKMQKKIESASRLNVSGYIANSHLMDYTDVSVVLEGYALAKQLSDKTGIPVEFVTMMENIPWDSRLDELTTPVVALKRNMLPPWMQFDSQHNAEEKVAPSKSDQWQHWQMGRKE